MKLVLRSPSDVEIPCLDWPTALVGLMCKGSPYWVERENPPPGKAFVASATPIGLRVTRWMGNGAIQSLSPKDIDRLMAGEDL